MLHGLLKRMMAGFIRTFAGVCVKYLDPDVFEGTHVYFANHTSHLDFLVIWSALPPDQRERCMPVAAKDYWEKGRIRRYLSEHVFHSLLIERKHVSVQNNPIRSMMDVLKGGKSLIIFPEGTRSPDGVMKPFKSGLHHLAEKGLDVRFVPVCLENLNRILPKGELLPVPLLSSVVFGRPLSLMPGESRQDFLARAFDSVKELCSDED